MCALDDSKYHEHYNIFNKIQARLIQSILIVKPCVQSNIVNLPTRLILCDEKKDLVLHVYIIEIIYSYNIKVCVRIQFSDGNIEQTKQTETKKNSLKILLSVKSN